MDIKKVINTAVSVSVICFTTSVMAADGAELYTAKGCAACHGADAKSPIMPVYPKLAGQSAEYLSAQMKDIKSGTRSNGQSAIMKGIVASMTDEEFDALAKYLAGLE